VRAAGLLLLALAAVPTLPAETTYVVRLTRPRKVGDRYRLEARGRVQERQRVTIGGKEAGDEAKDLAVQLVAAAKVLAVDRRSSPTRIEYAIESCRQTSAGKTDEVLSPGRRVVAEVRDGQTVFTDETGEPLPPETRESLSAVLSAHAPDSPTDDEIFGTRARKRVGDEWPINSDAAARDLSKSGLSVLAANLKGNVRLAGARKVDGVQALEVSAKLHAEQMEMPAPGGVHLEKAAMDGDFTGLFPADPESRVLLPDQVGFRMTFRMSGEKPDTGEKMTIDLSMETSLENSYRPLDAGTRPGSPGAADPSRSATPAATPTR
jgi:hypothetical protein